MAEQGDINDLLQGIDMVRVEDNSSSWDELLLEHMLVAPLYPRTRTNEMVSKGNNDIQERLQRRRLVHDIHLIQITSTQLGDTIEAEMTENAQAWITDKQEASKSFY
jgi:hypothetical protein